MFGLDIHQKVILINEQEPSPLRLRRSKHPASIPPSAEVHVIGDSESSHASIQQTRVKSTPSDINFIPSFKLLDDDDPEEEGDPAMDAKQEEHQVITEQSIFDHIREKSKNFPVLATANTSTSPSSLSALIRKRTREKQIEYPITLEIPEEAAGHEVSPISGVGTSRAFDEETIFDHICKKAKNFPSFEIPKAIQFKTSAITGEQVDGHLDAHSTYRNATQRDTIIISDSEPKENEDAYSSSNCIPKYSGSRTREAHS